MRRVVRSMSSSTSSTSRLVRSSSFSKCAMSSPPLGKATSKEGTSQLEIAARASGEQHGRADSTTAFEVLMCLPGIRELVGLPDVHLHGFALHSGEQLARRREQVLALRDVMKERRTGQ